MTGLAGMLTSLDIGLHQRSRNFILYTTVLRGLYCCRPARIMPIDLPCIITATPGHSVTCCTHMYACKCVYGARSWSTEVRRVTRRPHLCRETPRRCIEPETSLHLIRDIERGLPFWDVLCKGCLFVIAISSTKCTLMWIAHDAPGMTRNTGHDLKIIITCLSKVVI